MEAVGATTGEASEPTDDGDTEEVLGDGAVDEWLHAERSLDETTPPDEDD